MITKSPVDTSVGMRDLWFTVSARAGFYQLLKSLDFGDRETILIPAYVGITDREGSGVLDPVKQTGIAFDFYSVDEQLNANTYEIAAKLHAGGVRAVLLIHYFGFPQDDRFVISQLCEKAGVWLIEDCAHRQYSAFNHAGVGCNGDYAFFSIHKTLPTCGGGILRANNGHKGNELVLPMEHHIDRLDLEILVRADTDEIAKRRIANYQELCGLLSDCNHLSLMFPDLQEGVIPLNLPARVHGDQREPLYFYLMDRGMPTIALYYRLVEEISQDAYPLSHEISTSILNLPIHQDVQSSDLGELAAAIKQYFKEKN